MRISLFRLVGTRVLDTLYGRGGMKIFKVGMQQKRLRTTAIANSDVLFCSKFFRHFKTMLYGDVS